MHFQQLTQEAAGQWASFHVSLQKLPGHWLTASTQPSCFKEFMELIATQNWPSLRTYDSM